MQMLRVTRPTDTSCQRELLFVEYKQYKPPLESSPLTQVKHLDAKLHEATTWPPLCLRSVGTLVKVQTNGINTTEANRRAPERPRRNERPHVHKWVICISGCDVCLMPPGFVGQSRCYVRWTNLFTDFHNFIHPLAGSQTRRKSWPVMTFWGPASTQTCSLLLSNNYSDVVMATVARWRSLTRMCQRSLDLHISDCD